VSSGLYSASLSFYYLLSIVYGWKQDRLGKVEPFLHGVPLVFGIVAAITNIPLKNYNNAIFWCAVNRHPIGCKGSDCIRGANADTYRWAFFYVPLWLAFLVQTVNVLVVLAYVWRVEKKTESYNFRPRNNGPSSGGDKDSGDIFSKRPSNNSMKRTKLVAKQCFLYALGFYVTWTPMTVRLLCFACLRAFAFG